MRTLTHLAYGPHERNVLDLYLPDHPSGPLPLVVCIHGGGWTGGDKQNWAWEAAGLAESGFAAATINYRFCPEWIFPAQVDDVQRAVRWLRHHAARYGLDPSRLAAMGDSAGGHLGSFLGLTDTRRYVPDELAMYSSRVSCVVDCYGPVDMFWMVRSASAPILEKFLGRPLSLESTADYLAASPPAQIIPPVCPFLILHGTLDIGDTRGEVPFGISESFANRLRAAGGQVEHVLLEGGRHGFMTAGPQGPQAQQGMDLALAFLKKHLLR